MQSQRVSPREAIAAPNLLHKTPQNQADEPMVPSLQSDVNFVPKQRTQESQVSLLCHAQREAFGVCRLCAAPLSQAPRGTPC
jgi:hypothetical protein